MQKPREYLRSPCPVPSARHPAGVTALALALILPLASCVSHGGFATAGLPSLDPAYPLPEHEAYAEIPLNEVQTKIVAGALALNGKTSFTVGDKSFPADCTGVVRAAYAYAGIDLARDFGLYSGNGVRRLFMTLQKAGLLYAVKYPAPGDIVFWDNTYDANGNGKADDELTHVEIGRAHV